ncbi:PIN/TRAM domain-containing protein [Marinicrinis lubricantis]|uniref:PIN/TRAM domain-containing protein n=1 Tax=Marinicrinis lubricantis TaxID=2086470 RepID=A0ABW1IS04_9BACL
MWLNRWIQLAAIIAGALLGYEWYNQRTFLQDAEFGQWTMIGLGAAILWMAANVIGIVFSIVLKKGERWFSKVSNGELVAGLSGLLIGLMISALLYPAMSKLSGWAAWMPAVVTIALSTFGFRIGMSRKAELTAWLSSIRRASDIADVNSLSVYEHKILDTSVIIDGRIADICKTGFVEGTLVIPEFVLEELQHIADSSDLLKRNRGRRGLDILNKIQKELDVKVLIYEGDFDEISEVDSKLVKLAKVLQGKVVTNDFNLNKVCELQGVPVLNINDLANAVKPVVLPGEEILVQVIKDGKEYGQGVAYLDDGTMIVVEGGRDHIGSVVEVMVTSVLQTSAGRMIFAKPKLLEKAL